MLKKLFISIVIILFLASCSENNTEGQKKAEKKFDNDNNGVIISEQKVEKKGVGNEGQISVDSVISTNSSF